MGKKRTRKPRVGEIVCRCKAYKFPHRMIGGKCKGSQWVAVIFREFTYDCNSCNLYEDTHSCQVVEGLEPAKECPALQEFLDFESVPVPKFLRRKSWR